MGIYIYENHLSGSLYACTYPLSDDDLYCAFCGDSDWELGYFENRTAVRRELKERGYTGKYIKQFLKENFSKGGDNRCLGNEN